MRMFSCVLYVLRMVASRLRHSPSEMTLRISLSPYSKAPARNFINGKFSQRAGAPSGRNNKRRLRFLRSFRLIRCARRTTTRRRLIIVPTGDPCVRWVARIVRGVRELPSKAPIGFASVAKSSARPGARSTGRRRGGAPPVSRGTVDSASIMLCCDLPLDGENASR